MEPQPAQSLPRCTSPSINGLCTKSPYRCILLHSGPLLCGFNVPINGLMVQIKVGLVDYSIGD